MAQEFKLQDPGEGIHEVEVREILVSKGDHVEEGQDVLVVESDKAAIELPSPYDGEVDAIKVEEGDTVKVGDVLMVFSGGGDSEEKEKEKAEEPEKKGKAEEKETDEKQAKKDKTDNPVKALPAARRLAEERGIDLSTIEPSGSHGQITKADVEKAEQQPAKPGRERREKLKSIRRATAHHMTKAWAEIPHVSHEDDVDITLLDQLRDMQAEKVAKAGGHLTLTAYTLKAAASALSRHPRFNASYDAETEEIIYKENINIAVALDSKRGLLTPVIRDVNTKSVFDLAIELTELSDRVRDGTAEPKDLEGGTFTITNVGGIGGRRFAPIINHPQAAILGMARASLRPTVQDEKDIVPRYILPLILAFDHRIIDGAEAARFMNDIKAMLSNPHDFLLTLR